MNVIVYLNGYADAVALSDAEAAGKHYLIFHMMFLEGMLKQLHNCL